MLDGTDALPLASMARTWNSYVLPLTRPSPLSRISPVFVLIWRVHAPHVVVPDSRHLSSYRAAPVTAFQASQM